MAQFATLGMVVRYIRSTGEHVSATIIGPSTRGDDFFHGDGHELELLWTVSFSQSAALPKNLQSPLQNEGNQQR